MVQVGLLVRGRGSTSKGRTPVNPWHAQIIEFETRLVITTYLNKQNHIFSSSNNHFLTRMATHEMSTQNRSSEATIPSEPSVLRRHQVSSNKPSLVLASVALLGCLALLIRLETVQKNNGLHFEKLEKDLENLWWQKLAKGKKTDFFSRLFLFANSFDPLTTLNWI